MSKVKVGYLPLYIKLYDDANASKREPLVDKPKLVLKHFGIRQLAGVRPRLAAQRTAGELRMTQVPGRFRIRPTVVFLVGCMNAEGDPSLGAAPGDDTENFTC